MTGMHAPTLLLVVVVLSFAWAVALAWVAVPRKKDLLWCALAMALMRMSLTETRTSPAPLISSRIRSSALTSAEPRR